MRVRIVFNGARGSMEIVYPEGTPWQEALFKALRSLDGERATIAAIYIFRGESTEPLKVI